jgi:hypothetical protein
MATKFVETSVRGNQRRGLTTGVPERSPAPLHYVVVRHGDEGSEVLRIPLEAKSRVLPVFAAGWTARGYLFAEAPGGGWYVGPCAGVELVALDPRPGPRSGGPAATVMPWENFVDYLSGLTRLPSYFDGVTSRPPKMEPHGRRGDQ